MNRIPKLLLLLCFLTFFISCSKNHTEPQQDPTVLNKKIVLNPATKEPEKLQNVTTVNVDSSKLVIQFSNNNIPTYKKGDILIGSTGEGYLRKVESVAKVGNTLTITTSDASLKDAFSKLDIDTSLVFNPAIEQIAPINSSGIITIEDQKYNFSIECAAPQIATKALSESIPISLHNMKLKLESLDKASKLEVSVERIDVSFRIKADNLKVKLFSGEDNQIRIVYNINSITEFTNISMVFKGGIDDSFPKLDNLWPKDISLGTLFISAIPLHFSFNTGFGIQARFLVGVGANMISSFKIVENYDVGGEYINGTWNGIWEKSSTHTSSVDFKPIQNMTGDAKIYLKPKLKIKVADMIGPSLFVRGYVYGELGYPPIKAEAGYGLDGGLEFIVRAFNVNLANFQWVLAEKKWPQWSFINNEPNTPNSETPLDNSTNIPLSPTLSWDCSDADGDNLTYDVYFSTSNPPETLVSQGQTSKSYIKGTLLHNTKYFWRVIAVDSRGGSSVGPAWSFTTESVKTPSVTTSSITNITSTTASGGGTVTGDGGSQVTYKGVCWSTSQNPTTSNSKTSNGTGTGSFISSITGLTPNTTYYVRAYATNNQGTAYGTEVTFNTSQSLSNPSVITTEPTSISTNNATVGGNVTTSGNSPVTERGIVYSTSHNPTTSGLKVIGGSGTGTFNVNITGLVAGTMYYYRAYAINSQGTSYGSELSFTTQTSLLVPTVSTTLPTDVSLSGATLGGNVTSAGSSSVTERGIVYSTVQNPTTSNFKVLGGSGIGVFSINVTGLTADRLYYVRAYAINSQGTAYGSQVSFYTGLEPVAQFIASTLTINVNESVQFTDQSSNSPTSWNWNFGDGGTSTIQNPSHTYSTAGTYTVTLTVTNSHGSNTFTRNNYITVNEVSGNTVTDIDGNVYNTVTIGSQIWMKENLKTTRYRNGDLIGTTSPATLDISSQSNPKYQWAYNGNESNVSTYGRLYTWYAVTDSRNICPTGWHVPNDEEWTTLTTFLGGENVAGGKLKESGTTHWQSPNTGATNSSGFTALPGGGRGNDGQYHSIGYGGNWWSITINNTFNPSTWSMYFLDNKMAQSYSNSMYGWCVRCIKGDVLNTPTVTTSSISNITSTSSTSGGNVTSNGGSTVTARGVCWSTNHNPTISNSKTTDGTGNGSFTSNISGLVENTTYYVRAYATNSQGTAYGNEGSFTTSSSSGIIFNPNLTYGSVTDIDGNVYKTIQIGAQIWMAENLKTTRYRNGNIIGTTNPPNQRIIGEQFPKYQWPVNGDENNTAIYGRLYTWYAANDERGICPNGWHLPTRNDWQDLTIFLGGTNIADKLMETSTKHWPSRTFQATNSSGFTAIATGARHGTQQENVNGQFYAFGANTCWWSTNQVSVEGATGVGMAYYIDFIEISDGVFKNSGFSVRCIKD